VESSPAIANGKVYIGSRDNKVYCFEVENYPPNPPIIYEENGSLFMYSIDPDGDDIFYLIDWGDGTVDDWFGPYPSGEIIEINHQWSEPGTYEIRAKARDIHGAESSWSDPFIIIIENYPPNTPVIEGKRKFKEGEGGTYKYTIYSTDVDGDCIRYLINWSDGTQEWTDFYESGEIFTINVSIPLEKGTYTLFIVKAVDFYGSESDWAKLIITVPRGKSISCCLLLRFLERYPFLNLLLQRITI
jgi:outer membrane protein assembly factor BamB